MSFSFDVAAIHPVMKGAILFTLLFVCSALATQDFDDNDVNTFADLDEDRVTYFLHTQENPEEPTQVRINDSSIEESNFTISRPTMVLVHGFLESANFPQIVDLRQAYVSNFNHNVIVVNFEGYKPSDGDTYIFYQQVGQAVSSFVRYLIEDIGLKPNDTHIIGHSVGVHVAGEAGKLLRNDHKVRRITGLDPANWGDLGTSPMDILRPTDAEIVDCIHTSTSFGIHNPICKCNFYPHGGANQPGCTDIIGLCDHLSSFRYYQATFAKPELYPAYKCEKLVGNTLQNCTQGIAGYMGTNEDLYCDDGIYDVPIIQPSL